MKLPKSAPSKVKRGMEILKSSYPQLFASNRPLPLSVGVKDEILGQQSESRTAIRRALRFYCNNLSYLSSFEKHKTRYGLDGKPAEPITETDKEYAAQKVSEIKSKLAAKQPKAQNS